MVTKAKNGDLDIDVAKILVEDDASRMQDEIPFEKRRPRYVRRSLPTAPLNLTPEERAALDEMWSPTRPGFIEVIRDAMGYPEKNKE